MRIVFCLFFAFFALTLAILSPEEISHISVLYLMKSKYQLIEGMPSASKRPYEPPCVEAFFMHQPLNILETVSLEGEVEDFKDADDF